MNRRNDAPLGCFLVIWLMYALGSLAFSVFLVWAAFHFILKFW